MKALLLATLGAAAPSGEEALRRAQELYQKGDFPGAAQQFEKAVESRPNDAEAMIGAGAAYYELGAFDRAREAFERAAKSAESAPAGDPGRPAQARSDALYDLGNAKFREENLDGAIEAYREALRQEPGAEDLRHNLAVALMKKPPPPDPRSSPKDKPPPPPKQGQKPPPPKGGMSPEDAKRLLEAVREREKTRPPPEGKQGQGKPQVEEDW